MKLTKNVYVETGFQGANVGYVVTENGVVMTDTPLLPQDMIAWQKEIEAKGPVRYLVNLEYHSDHCFGNFICTATAVAHEETRKAMLETDFSQDAEIMAILEPHGVKTINKSNFNIPSITFSDRLTLYLGKHSFQLIHLPGHTTGQIAVFVPEERVVFTADNITYNLRPVLAEADALSWLESLAIIEKLEVDYIVPGHGEICDKDYIKEQAKYIQDCLDAVKQAIRLGWTKEEAMCRVSLPTYIPLEKDLEKIELQLMRMAISRIYDALSGQKSTSVSD